ncbi:LLM class flavin-dependent oxidoreductase [Tepidiforma flava]|uniref:LLM class flavin-dependent oxidoreductase n=1 Tax=Tepidiforma flava TaxID=3004094 RepID=UPI0035714966
MKFGIFYEISVPRPWGPTTEYEVYQNCLEQVKLADELGFDQVWAVEHHFLEEYSHCSAPEVFLTACAMVTKNIRIGRGIVVCVPEFNNPIKAAEVAATMDIVSGGRLEFGTGRSATWTELGGCRPTRMRRRRRGTNGCGSSRRCGRRSGSATRARFSMPQRAVLPKPLQKPHPPMWVAVTSPGTELDAADRGMGSPGLTFGGFAEQEQKIAEYRRRIKYCNPVGSFVNEQVNTVNFLFATRTTSTGRRRASGWRGRSTTSRSSCWRRGRPTRRGRIRTSGCCRRCGGRRRARRRGRSRKDCASATRTGSSRSSRSGSRSVWTGSTSC